ncbi:MAG: hypothetical protein ACOX6I_03155 [Syntrophomonadaceae bacterium]|jgi:hypothetical protein
MVKENINRAVEQFRGKLERARSQENSSTEIKKAVQELLQDIGQHVPKAPERPRDPQKAMETAAEFVKSYNKANGKTPQGVQTMLNNLAAKKKKENN